MDRKAWIAVTLSVIGLIALYYYYGTTPPPRRQAPAPAAQASPVPAASAVQATPAPAAPVAPSITARTESVSARSAEYVFSNDKGGIQSAILLLHKGENMQAVSLNNDASMPIGAIGIMPGQALGGFEMQTDSAKGEITFTRRDGDGVEITKRFHVPLLDTAEKSGQYVVRMDLEFRNTGSIEAIRPPYFVSTGGAAPIHRNDYPMYTRFDWMHDGKMSNIDVNWFNASTVPLIGIQWSPARAIYQEVKAKTAWAAVASQYFCTIVTSVNPENREGRGTGVWALRFDTIRGDDAKVHGIQGGLNMPGFVIPAGQTYRESFTIYAGPKELGPLRKLGYGESAVLNFGMFGFISELLLWGMNSLHAILGSYAAAIIVLTLIIKSLLWPVQNKATNEMRKMSLLSPKMTEMREKYKDDPQKMNEEMMKLYREYGVNPFSGCLPMLIQIPIFFGFYAMLGSAIELRNSSFLWVQDLSQPDTVGHILGFPINVLPLVMAASQVWQMIITPKSGDAMQQRIFYFMPVIFLVFCYNYASGLALYWTTQNIFSIVQLYLTRNKPLPTLEKKSTIAKREAKASKKKKRPGL